MSKFKSQIGQDKYVSDVIFNNKRDGYFIELGATDGVELSNTHYLEKELGWKGLCIEPQPKYASDLKKNRSCSISTSPIYSKSGETVEFSIVDCGELSGIKQHLGCIPSVYNIDSVIELTTKTLTDVLDEVDAPKYIDYMSLDTEGSELEVLKGLDFDKYTIGYISVEHNYKQPMRSMLGGFLHQNEYVYSRWNRFDDEYMHHSLAKLFQWSNSTTNMTPESCDV